MSTEEDSEDFLIKATTSSLFPAYALPSDANQQGDSDTKQEWLCNSSFTPDAFQVVQREQTHCLTNLHEEEIELEQKDVGKCLLDKRNVNKSKSKEKKKKFLDEKAEQLFSKSTSLRDQLNKYTFIEEAGLSIERAYREDSRYDAENIAFGTFDRKCIAKYNSKIQVPMGATGKELLWWCKFSKRKKSKSVSRYFTKDALKQLRTVEISDCVCTAGKQNAMERMPEYIQLSVNSETSLKGASEMKYFDGISKEWKSDYAVNFPSSNSEATCLPDLVTVLEKELREKVTYFNTAIIQTPHDENLWLDFVDFQNELFQSQSFFKNRSIAERSVLEKQVAILDKSLKHNPGSVKLTVAKLKLCRNLWDINDLVSSWDNLIFFHPHDIIVWQEYLQFVLSDMAYFNVPRITKVYSRCLRMLSNLCEGNIKSHQPSPDILHDMMEIFSQLCIVFQSCGYQERALGTFQALVEFNLFTPSSVNESTCCSERIVLFEPFWDSGAPRIGEENAIGWATTVEERKINTNVASLLLGLNSAEDQILSCKLPQWETWLEFEKLRESQHWLPWRPNAQLDQIGDDLEDPDRTVSFDDISGFLFKVTEDSQKFNLFCHFLSFLGVNIHLVECTFFPRKVKNSQILFESLDYLSELLEVVPSRKHVSNALHIKNHSTFHDFLKFLDNVFQQISQRFSSKYATLISLIWVKHLTNSALKNKTGNNWLKSIEKVKKFAKTTLKRSENRNCLFLWSEYIYIESLSNNKEKGKQMFETLLVSSTDVALAGVINYKALWYFVRRYIQLATEKLHSSPESISEFVWVLSYIGSKEKYVPYASNNKTKCTLLIKAMAGFRTAINQEFSSLNLYEETLCACLEPSSQPILDCTFCAAYLQYFTNGLSAAMQLYNDALQFLSTKIQNVASKNARYIEEQLFVSKAELLNFHTWNTTSSLKPLQTHLYKAVEKFPSNCQLLRLLVKIKSASSVIGPTRRFFYKLLMSNHQLTPITWLFAIASELTICYSIQEPWHKSKTEEIFLEEIQPIRSCGLIWKIRSLFERALRSSSQYCVPLWRSFIQFEIQNGDASKAKSVFYQALQNCAWSKALYLDGIKYFNEDMHNLLDMMSEKQLRIHTPIEEVALLMQHMSKDD